MIYEFQDRLIRAKQDSPGKITWLEAPLDICEHYNRTSPEGFRETGYFILQDVKVCAEGTLEKVRRQEAMTMEDRMFSRSQVGVVPVGANKSDNVRHE